MACILREGVREWTGGVLPFTINTAGFTTSAQSNITRAIAHWNDNTNWVLRQRNRERNYVTFRVGQNCSSALGRQGGRQFINLTNTCSFGNAVHEIAHAIGFAHEQSRVDRDSHVVVMADRVEPDALNNFNKASAQTYRDHGDYDYRSIMHYPRAAFLRPKRRDWSSGWSIARPFEVGGTPHLFLLKTGNGVVHTHRLDPDIGVSHEVERDDWSSGWTSAEFFERSGRTYLFLLKESNGTVHVNRMNADGTVGSRAHTRDWSSGWTTTEFYEIDGRMYLFLLKSGNGTVHIHRMNASGRVGAEIERDNWSSGWTTAKVYTVGGSTFLFLLKRSNGLVHIHEMNNNGTIGARLFTEDWSSGWSNVQFFYNGARTFLWLSKAGTGDVHIHQMNNNGSVGRRVDDQDWTRGWTSTEIYEINGRNYLFLLKTTSGRVHLHKMTAGGRVGDELGLTPPITIYAPSSIGQRRGLSAGDIAAANDRIG